MHVCPPAPTSAHPDARANWITLQCERIDVDLLTSLARQDGSNKSAMVRRLIREEALRRGIVGYDQLPQ